MINVSEAICADTTTTCYLRLPVEGYYDDNNLWVSGGLGAPIRIAATPIPVGDYEEGTHGQTLKADAVGERMPATFKFHSVFEMPINAIMTYKGHQFKIIKTGDYAAAGYWSAVGVTDTTVNPDEVAPFDYPANITIRRRNTPVNVNLLRSLHAS